MDRLPARQEEGEDNDQYADHQRDAAKGEKCTATGRLSEETGVIVGVEVLAVRKTLVTEERDDQPGDENPVFGLDHMAVRRRRAESPNISISLRGVAENTRHLTRMVST